MWVSFAVSGEDTSRAGSLDYGKNNFSPSPSEFFFKGTAAKSAKESTFSDYYYF